ncbi:hypothetical protein FB451DRAFT_1234501 [Mycena latifolia]|nr:hypothetical protein FB451DRAFT_1234501 [Mycena latifolia]
MVIRTWWGEMEGDGDGDGEADGEVRERFEAREPSASEDDEERLREARHDAASAFAQAGSTGVGDGGEAGASCARHAEEEQAEDEYADDKVVDDADDGGNARGARGGAGISTSWMTRIPGAKSVGCLSSMSSDDDDVDASGVCGGYSILVRSLGRILSGVAVAERVGPA